MIAPLIVFAYNRAIHLEKTLTKLNENTLADKTKLYIYADGSKNAEDEAKVQEVHKYLDNFKENNNFLEVEIIKAPKNQGLANSVIKGVSEVINKHGRIIVVEDDLITTKDFLSYMNESLDFYKDNNKIWSITGYTPPLKELENYEHDVYLGYRASSHGWAMWKDRWDLVDWEVSDYGEFKNNHKMQQEFNICGPNVTKMLDSQMQGKIDSWAVRWCYSAIKHNMLTVFPKYSKIFNNGMDGSGRHCGKDTLFDVEIYEKKLQLQNVELDNELVLSFYNFYNPFRDYSETINKFIEFLKEEKDNSVSIYGVGLFTESLLFNMYHRNISLFNKINCLHDNYNAKENKVGTTFYQQDITLDILALKRPLDKNIKTIAIGSVSGNAIDAIYERIKWAEDEGIEIIELGKDYIYKRIDIKKMGNNYGGFYVATEYTPKDKDLIVYSCGIGEDISFDIDMLNNYPLAKIWGFDPTPKSIKWINKNMPSERFYFEPIGISNEDGTALFNFPIVEEYVSGSILKTNNVSDKTVEVTVSKIKKIMERLGHDRIDILKMDIEGSEYQVLDDILNDKIEINQLCIEFHARFIENGQAIQDDTINKVLKAGFTLVSAGLEEYTFVKMNFKEEN